MYNENAKNRTIRYMKGSRDKLTINLPKGKKDEYKEYAQSKGMSLTEIALLSGFQSIPSFNRVFRELKGLAPSEYRSMNVS